MTTSEEFNARAQEYYQLARKAGIRGQRDILFDMARTWEMMAKHAARFERQKQTEDVLVR
jgi:hypothetical protein